MNALSIDALASYWSTTELTINFVIFLNLLGALLLGLLVGYERSYRGRAAGMRTYGLVCMASAALTVVSGYPSFWFGGHATMSAVIVTDPTRVIQGVVTGIGFLGAGVIMKEGFNISGLTTAASIWTSSAIGIMVGLGFYAAAILLALLSAALMLWVTKLENWLPSRQAVAITLKFRRDAMPRENVLREIAGQHGYEIAGGSMSISAEHGLSVWQFVAVARRRGGAATLGDLARELSENAGVESFRLSYARN